MKNTQSKQKLQAAGILAAVLLLALAPITEARPGQGWMSHQKGQHDFNEPSHQFFEQLNLSDQQSQTITQLHTKARKRAIPLKAELEILRIDLEDVIQQNNATPKTVETYAEKTGNIHVQLCKNRLKTRLAIRQVLSPKQRLQKDIMHTNKKGKRFSKSGRNKKRGRF
jgi:Spy/CpxP family protein refolding chaperone